MDCRLVQDRLDAWLDRELPLEESAAVDAHLSSCETCRREADDRIEHERLLRRALATTSTSTESQFSAAHSARVRRRRLGVGIAAIVGVSLVVILMGVEFVRLGLWDSRWTKAGQIVVVDGTIDFRTIASESWETAKTLQTVGIGDSVRTGRQGCCDIRLGGVVSIALDQESEVTLTRTDCVQLKKGRAWIRLTEGGNSIEIDCPRVKIGADSVTEFDVAVSPENTTVISIRGSVEVQLGEAAQTLDVGRQICVKSNGAAVTGTIEDLLAATEWLHRLLRLKPANDQELCARVDSLIHHLPKHSVECERQLRLLGGQCCEPLLHNLQANSGLARDDRRRFARIVTDLGQPASVPGLVTLLADRDGEIRRLSAQSLVRITGMLGPISPEQFRDSDEATYRRARIEWEKNLAPWMSKRVHG